MALLYRSIQQVLLEPVVLYTLPFAVHTSAR